MLFVLSINYLDCLSLVNSIRLVQSFAPALIGPFLGNDGIGPD